MNVASHPGGSFEKANETLREVYKLLDDEETGGPMPAAEKVQLVKDYEDLVGEAGRILDSKKTLSGSWSFPSKARKLETKAKKFKEAVEFSSNIARLRVQAQEHARRRRSQLSPATQISPESPPAPTKYSTSLLDYEILWCKQCRWLEAVGYKLRSRYSPGWIPSWGPKSRGVGHEDSGFHESPAVMDATRLKDGASVMLKRVSKSRHPDEVQILLSFSSSSRAFRSKNHTIPVYDVLQAPDDEDTQIIVMPRLRKFDSPPFEILSEVIEFLRQTFEGLQYLHKHSIAHLDFRLQNIMMDASKLYPEGFHPIDIDRKLDYTGAATHLSRNACPPKYHIVGFGASRRYKPSRGSTHEVGLGRKGSRYQRSVDPSDMCSTDIYDLGVSIKEVFIEDHRRYPNHALGFIYPLVQQMLELDPSRRPTINEVVDRFDQTWRSLNEWTLFSRLVVEKPNPLFGLIRGLTHKRNESAAPAPVKPITAPSSWHHNRPPAQPLVTRPDNLTPQDQSRAHGQQKQLTDILYDQRTQKHTSEKPPPAPQRSTSSPAVANRVDRPVTSRHQSLAVYPTVSYDTPTDMPTYSQTAEGGSRKRAQSLTKPDLDQPRTESSSLLNGHIRAPDDGHTSRHSRRSGNRRRDGADSSAPSHKGDHESSRRSRDATVHRDDYPVPSDRVDSSRIYTNPPPANAFQNQAYNYDPYIDAWYPTVKAQPGAWTRGDGYAPVKESHHRSSGTSKRTRRTSSKQNLPPADGSYNLPEPVSSAAAPERRTRRSKDDRDRRHRRRTQSDAYYRDEPERDRRQSYDDSSGNHRMYEAASSRRY